MKSIKISFWMFLLLNASAILAQNVKMAPITGSFLLCEGESRRLNCATKGGVWESLDSEVISIDEKGMMVANKKGSTTIFYKIKVEDEVLESKVEVSVDESPKLEFLGKKEICQGESTEIEVKGAEFVLWEKEDGFAKINSKKQVLSPDSTRIYEVSGIIGVCKSKDLIEIKVNPLPQVAISKENDEYKLEGYGSTSPYIYKIGEGDFSSEKYFKPSTSDYYNVQVKDAKGCVGISKLYLE